MVVSLVGHEVDVKCSYGGLCSHFPTVGYFWIALALCGDATCCVGSFHNQLLDIRLHPVIGRRAAFCET